MKKKATNKKGKKNWRKNIDTYDIEQTVEQFNKYHKNQQEYQQIQQKLDQQQPDQLIFYVEDSQQSSRRRQPLDPDRFKKKDKPKIESKAHKKIINRLVRQQKYNGTRQSRNDKVDKVDEVGIDWDKNQDQDQQKIVGLVKPHPGQSYNPTFKQHQKLLDEIVEQEQENDKIRVFGSKKQSRLLEQSKQIRKKKKMSQREVEIEQQKQQKKEKNQPSQLKKVSKQLDQEKEQQKIKKQLDQIQKDQNKELNRQGLKDLKQKFGKYKYKLPEKAFQFQSELSDNLRTLDNQNEVNLRERFDTFYRRKLLEKGDPFKSKNRRALKQVDLDRRKMDKEDKMGELGIMD